MPRRTHQIFISKTCGPFRGSFRIQYYLTTLSATFSLGDLSLWINPGAGGGGYSTDAWVARRGPGVQTLTLFKTQFSDFHIPFETEFKIFRPYLRHLTQEIPRLGLE